MKTRFLIKYFLLFVATLSFAQQGPRITQYKMNGFLYNPALVGVDQIMLINLTIRDQWAGYDNPPRTLWANYHTRVTNKKFGVGGSLFSDRDGLLNNFGAQGMYAYHIPLRDAQLSLGASFSFYQYKINKKDMVVNDLADPLLNDQTQFYVPDAGIGAYYKTFNYYAGFSMANILESSLRFGNGEFSETKNKRVYYLMGGYLYKYSSDIVIEPHTLIKVSQKTQVDFNIAATYQAQYWGGIGFRTSKELMFFAGLNYQMFIIGYAFDYALNDLHRRNFSTHEILLSARFGKSTSTRFQGSDIY